MKKIDELYQKKMLEFGFGREDVCSDEECKQYRAMLANGESLPDNIRQSTENQDVFLRRDNTEISQEEIFNLMWLYLYNNVATIKKCILFLTAIVAVLLVLGIIMGVSISNSFSAY